MGDNQVANANDGNAQNIVSSAPATAHNDQMRGLSGDDTISGGKGKDLLFGNDGTDVLNGDEDDDIIEGDWLRSARVCAMAEGRGGETNAGERRAADRGDCRGGRLLRPCLLPPALPQAQRPGARRLPTALPVAGHNPA